MAIQIGKTIPDVHVTCIGDGVPEALSSGDLFKGKTAVVIGLPGAFTPICTEQHLKGYLNSIDTIKASGIDQLVCISVNDRFVLQAWAKSLNALDKIIFISDWDAEMTKKLGLEIDLSTAGLGLRSKRYVMIVQNQIIKALEVEENPSICAVSSANSIQHILARALS